MLASAYRKRGLAFLFEFENKDLWRQLPVIMTPHIAPSLFETPTKLRFSRQPLAQLPVAYENKKLAALI